MDAKRQKEEIVYPDGGYGWVIVFAIILINSSVLTLTQCFGIIFSKEFTSKGVTAAETSFLLHLNSSIFCCVGFFSSPFLKKYGFRGCAFVGASLMSFGILLSSFLTSYGALLFSISILMGFGQGVLMPATYLATYSYFKKRLTIAVSISVTGASLSSIYMPIICGLLLNRIGRQYTVLILFFISLLSLVGSFLLKPVKTKEDKNSQLLNDFRAHAEENDKEDGKEKLVKNTSVYKDTTIPLQKEDNIFKKLFKVFDLQLLKQLSYVIVVLGVGVSFASESNIIFMMQFLLPELSKFTTTDVTYVTSVQYVSDLIGRLVIPILSHLSFQPHPKLMYGGALIIATIARTVLATCGDSRMLVYFCCSLFGLMKGTRAVFQSVIIPRYVALDKLPAATGLNMFFNGIVSLIIGPVIGAIHDSTNSYVPALHAVSVLSCLCVLLWMGEYLFCKKNEDNNES